MAFIRGSPSESTTRSSDVPHELLQSQPANVTLPVVKGNDATPRRFEDLFSAHVKPWLAEQDGLISRDHNVSLQDRKRSTMSPSGLDLGQSISDRFHDLCHRSINSSPQTGSFYEKPRAKYGKESPRIRTDTSKMLVDSSSPMASTNEHAKHGAGEQQDGVPTNTNITADSCKVSREEQPSKPSGRSSVGKDGEDGEAFKERSKSRTIATRRATNGPETLPYAHELPSDHSAPAPQHVETNTDDRKTSLSNSIPSSASSSVRSSLAEPLSLTTASLEEDESGSEDEAALTSPHDGINERRAGIYQARGRGRGRGRGRRSRRGFTSLHTHRSARVQQNREEGGDNTISTSVNRGRGRGRSSLASRVGSRTTSVRNRTRSNESGSAPSSPFPTAPKQVLINPPGSAWRWALHKPGRRPKELVVVFKF